MDRRGFLAAAGAAGLAGCLGWGGSPASDASPWRYDLGVTAPRADATVTDDGVYVVTDGGLYCLDYDGTRRWAAPAPYDSYRFTGLPVVGGDAVYLHEVPQGGPPGSSYPVAFDRETGNMRWRAPLGRVRLLAATDEAVFCGTRDDVIRSEGELTYALAAADGSELWRTPSGTGVRAVTHRGGLYVNHLAGISAIDTDSGEKHWVYQSSPGVSGPMVPHDQSLYCPGEAVVALDTRDGDSRWRYRIPGTDVFGANDVEYNTPRTVAFVPEAPFVGSLQAGLYVGDWRGNVHALSAGDLVLPGVGRRIWQFAGETEYRDSSVHGVVAAAHGVYFELAGRLYCLDPTTGGEAWRVDLRPLGPESGPVVVHDAVAIVAAPDGGAPEVRVFGAETGERRWAVTLDDDPARIRTPGGRVRALTGVAGRFLVATDAGTVYAGTPEEPPPAPA